MPMTRGRWLAAVAGVAAAGAAWVYLRDKRPWTPPYAIDASEGAVELRVYPAITVAATVQPGKRDRALGNGFGLLADYAFGEGREGEELPMTVPLIATPVGKRGWEVRLPIPDGRAEGLAAAGGVSIATIPARAVAAIRFSGKADDALLAAQEAELRGWLEARGIAVTGAVEHALYNSPMLPGRARHNEVWLPV